MSTWTSVLPPDLFFFKLLPLSEGGGGIQQQHERRGLLSAQ